MGGQLYLFSRFSLTLLYEKYQQKKFSTENCAYFMFSACFCCITHFVCCFYSFTNCGKPHCIRCFHWCSLQKWTTRSQSQNRDKSWFWTQITIDLNTCGLFASVVRFLLLVGVIIEKLLWHVIRLIFETPAVFVFTFIIVLCRRLDLKSVLFSSSSASWWCRFFFLVVRNH